ncbi:MAG: hypothetical protein [Caudoviricetes sp.]|nr:MAG: hypothetical protein [Caudoviricetes sp.]
MQKTDLELQNVVLDAIEDADDSLSKGYENRAFEEFMSTLTSKGYKIVKDADQ